MVWYDMRRRRLLIALGTASGVGLAGCPSTDDDGSTSTTGTEGTPTPTTGTEGTQTPASTPAEGTPTPTTGTEGTPTPTQTPAEGYGLERYGQYGYGS